jgi:hypothetical protein
MHGSRTKDKTIHSEAREMINRVNRLCKQEAEEKNLILPISRADERTANCCGVSAATVRQIRRESREGNEGRPLRFPDKKRPRKYERSVILDDFDLCLIKRTVIDFYVENKFVPICKKLLPAIREKNKFSLRGAIFKQGTQKNHLSGENAKARESFFF